MSQKTFATRAALLAASSSDLIVSGVPATWVTCTDSSLDYDWVEGSMLRADGTHVLNVPGAGQWIAREAIGAITGNLTTGTLGNLQTIVGLMLDTLAARGLLTKGTT